MLAPKHISIEIKNNTVILHLLKCSLAITCQYGNIPYLKRVALIGEKCKEVLDGNINLLIDARGEAQFFLNLVETLVNYLKYPINKTKIILSVEPNNSLKSYDYTINHLIFTNIFDSYDEISNLNIDWKNLLIDKYFISLCGRPTVDRAALTKSLLDLCGDKIRASFGTTQFAWFNQGQINIFTQLLYPYKFPLVLDRTFSDEYGQYTPPRQEIFHSLINIVNETHPHTEKQVFITEKTFKCFSWRQLPIFVTVPNHVQLVRDLGFDVFDDIFDGHQYDKKFSRNHDLQILSLVKKILDKYPSIEYIIELRNRLWSRIEANALHLAKLIKEDKIGE
jgi:hypothetical protein